MSNIVPLNAGGAVSAIVPQNIEEVFRLATAIHKSGLAPSSMNTAEKLTVAILTGLEIGLRPMFAIQKIAVINGRPAIWGDAVPALLLARGFKISERMAGGDETRCAICEITRPNGDKVERVFSKTDAITAGLWGKPGPWKSYPDRMLQMRARGFAARDAAADVLAGLYLHEEIDGGELQEVRPKRKSSNQAKKDGDYVRFEEIKLAFETAPTLDVLKHLVDVHEDDLNTMPREWATILQNTCEDRQKDLEHAEPVEAEASQDPEPAA
jgi:hypothetical protein